MFKSLKWRITSIFFLLSMLIVISIGTFLIYSVENTYKNEFISQVKQSELSFEELNISNLNHASSEYQNELFKVFKYKFSIDNIYRKGYLLDKKGNVLLNSDLTTQNYSYNKTYLTKTENLITAMNGEIGDILDKNSDTLDYAKPIFENDEVNYILYLIYNEDGIQKITDELKNIILVSIFIALSSSTILGYIFAKAITKPIEKITKTAKKMAEGDFQKIENDSEDEIGKLSDTFNYMAGEVELTLNQRKEFVANVSHELKTPITSIKTYSETLLNEGIEDKKSSIHFIEVINSEADRMARIVSDLLQLSRFDYNQKVWEKVPINTEELIIDVIQKMKLEAEKKNQTIEYEIREKKLKAVADKDGLIQVLTNIISNAIKYTKEGGKIKIIVEKFNKNLQIRVIDNGIGIPENDIERIFERFYRVDKGRSREMGGTGLGLSIAKEIIEANEGEIKIKSKLEKGTEVTITLKNVK